MSKFLTDLDIICDEKCESLWRLEAPLLYKSDLLKTVVVVPRNFLTDLASVPRLPFLYLAWGSRAHREAVIHDYLYRTDSVPVVSFRTANAVFLEAMESRGKPWRVCWAMFAGVWIGGYFKYHKKPAQWGP